MEALLLKLLASKVLVPLVPLVMGFVRTWVLKSLPPSLVPLLLSVAGALVGAVESQVGLPVTDLAMAGAGAWEGALMGLAAVGVHQLWNKIKEWKAKPAITGLLAVAALGIVGDAKADIANGLPTFNWTQPTSWSDGTALTASQITGYQLNCSGAATVNRRVSAAAGVPPSVTPAANRFAPGQYTCSLAVYAKKTTADPEVMGTFSGPVSFTVPQPTPGAVTGFSVE